MKFKKEVPEVKEVNVVHTIPLAKKILIKNPGEKATEVPLIKEK